MIQDAYMRINSLQFHPFTGNALEQKEGSRYEDSKTGRSYFANPNPTISVIITNDRKEVLLAKRAIEPHKNTWDLPGGFVEIGETLEECVRREIQEELGVVVHESVFFSSQVGTYEYETIVSPILDSTFICTLETMHITPADDVSEVAFFALDSIPFNEIKMIHIRTVLQKYSALHA